MRVFIYLFPKLCCYSSSGKCEWWVAHFMWSKSCTVTTLRFVATLCCHTPTYVIKIKKNAVFWMRSWIEQKKSVDLISLWRIFLINQIFYIWLKLLVHKGRMGFIFASTHSQHTCPHSSQQTRPHSLPAHLYALLPSHLSPFFPAHLPLSVPAHLIPHLPHSVPPTVSPHSCPTL